MPENPLESSLVARARAPGKRQREQPAPGIPLCVENPEISVLHQTVDGAQLLAQDVLGTDYPVMMQLRSRVRDSYNKGRPLLRCATCLAPVFICGRPDGQKFFFKHTHEDGSCPAITRGGMSRDDIDARRYNGAKETLAHLQMKEWIEAGLQADPHFSEVKKEVRWSSQLTGEWRKPDVSAVYRGLRVVFEIQLTTTYLDVILKRREFYLREGALLFWIFASFDNEHRRLMEDDVFYNNNQNAFIVNPSTTQESLEKGRFMLECAWQVPPLDDVHSVLHRQRISFDELTLDPPTQRAFYFDYDGEKQGVISQRQTVTQLLRDELEAWWDRRRDEDAPYQNMWDQFAPRLHKTGVQIPDRFREVDDVLIAALYSAKNNRPWGSRKKRLVEVAHHIATAERDRLVWFMHAVKRYGRGQSMPMEGAPGAWAAKYRRCKEDYRADKSVFLPERKSQLLAEFLFPELMPFPQVVG